MPEHIRALVVILALAGGVFFALGRSMHMSAEQRGDFGRRRNLWIIITCAAFLSHNIWLFFAIASFALVLYMGYEKNVLAMFFFLMFVVPQISGTVPGFGVLDHLFTIDITRVLVLILLLPAFISLVARGHRVPLGSTAIDRFILLYVLLELVLLLRATSFTNAIRHGVLYAFVDILLPYCVASRCTRGLSGFRDAVTAFVAATAVLAGIAVFEGAKRWLLYDSLPPALAGADAWEWNYLPRGDWLRAVATTGQPIPLGYVVTVGLGFALGLKSMFRSEGHRIAVILLLCAGLLATVSRGPWVGAMAMAMVFVLTGPSRWKTAFYASMFTAVLLGAVALSPLADELFGLLPFVGNIEPQNAEFRQRFLEASLLVISQNPWFGSESFVYASEFETLRNESFLDTLNVFITVALRSGLVGLFFFAGAFALAGAAVAVRLARAHGIVEDDRLLGRALVSVLGGIVLILNTISAITIIPLVYWLVIGLCAAYGSLPIAVSNVQRH
jgi:O-Antigen ligase